MKKNKAALLALLLPFLAYAQDDKQIQQWLTDLEAYDIGTREEAQMKLTDHFKLCEKKLRELDANTTDAETKHRLSVILKQGPRGRLITQLDDKLSEGLKAKKKDIADLAYSSNPADWKPVFQTIEAELEPRKPGQARPRGKGGDGRKLLYPAAWEDRVLLMEAVLENAISRFGDLSKLPKEPFDITLSKLLRAAELSENPKYEPFIRPFLKHENENIRHVSVRYIIAAFPREKKTEEMLLEHLDGNSGASHLALVVAREWRMADRYWKQMEAIAVNPKTNDYYSKELKAMLSTTVRGDE